MFHVTVRTQDGVAGRYYHARLITNDGRVRGVLMFPATEWPKFLAICQTSKVPVKYEVPPETPETTKAG